MRKLAAGYFLSAFNALTISPLIIYLFSPALVTYPASILLRGVGWRGMGVWIGWVRVGSLAILGLGAVTFISVVAGLSGGVSSLLYVAAFTWTSYSVIEAFAYVTVARASGVRLFYVGGLNIVGVALADLLLLMLPAINTSAIDTSLPNIYLIPVFLFISAVSVGIGFLRTKSKPLANQLFTPKPLPPTQYTPPRTKTTQGPLLKIAVVKVSGGIVCIKCGTLNAVELKKCSSCGHPFVKTNIGLKCPICGAPYALFKKVGGRYFLCGQCESTLYLEPTAFQRS